MYSPTGRPWQDSRPIVLLGAGQLGKMALQMWPRTVKRPVMILDRHATGEISGVRITPSHLHTPDPNFLYVLAYFKASPDQVSRLFDADLNQPVITVYDILSEESPATFSNGWHGDPVDLQSVATSVGLFEDEESKRIFEANIEWRYSRHLRRDYPVGREEDKYALKRYGLESREFDTVVDAGSFDLSFGLKLKEDGFGWRRYVSLEPDPGRYADISGLLQGTRFREWAAEHHQVALWNRSGEVDFLASGLLSARIPHDPMYANTSVAATTLEAVVRQSGTHSGDSLLVKLHIEGAEWPVVESSVRLLSRPGPTVLLVNLSHDEASLTEIPALLNKMSYRMKLHSHSLFGEGLTLFAWKESDG